jgi:hypothetical protein
MTVISVEKIVQQSRTVLWQVASQFAQASRWIDGVKKTEPFSGRADGVGGVWRVHLRWSNSYQIVDFEITEWLEGERFSLRPASAPARDEDVELYQLVLNLKSISDHQTRVTVQCEYKPLNRLAKIKNLVHLRRRYLQRAAACLERLERVALEQ